MLGSRLYISEYMSESKRVLDHVFLILDFVGLGIQGYIVKEGDEAKTAASPNH